MTIIHQRPLLVLMTFAVLLLSACGTVSNGWQPLSREELSDDWRAESKDRFTVIRADFNGDSLLDEARLLKRSDNGAFGLFVSLSQKNEAPLNMELIIDNDIGKMEAMGIRKVEAGKYTTSCGKGHWDCQNGELPEIVITHDAIDLFKYESANSYIYWNDKTNRLERVWISD